MILRARQQGYKPKVVIAVLGKKTPTDAPWDWLFFESRRDFANADLRPIYRCCVYFHGEAWPEVINAVESKELVFVGHQAVSKNNVLSRDFASFTHEAMRDMTWKS
jgi:hypothetical protein